MWSQSTGEKWKVKRTKAESHCGMRAEHSDSPLGCPAGFGLPAVCAVVCWPRSGARRPAWGSFLIRYLQGPHCAEAEAWLQSAQPGGLGRVVMLRCPRHLLPSLPLPYSLPGGLLRAWGWQGSQSHCLRANFGNLPPQDTGWNGRVLCGEPLPRSHRFNLWWDPQTTSWAGLLQGHISRGVRCPLGHLTKTRDACALTAISSYS